MLTRSWRISSLVVITRELAWKPRCAMTRLVNSWARSTFDISSAPLVIKPRPPEPAAPTWARPEFTVLRNIESPTFSRPLTLLKLARATWPSVCLRPLEKTPTIWPVLETVYELSTPDAEPSELLTWAVVSPLYWVTSWMSNEYGPAVTFPESRPVLGSG